MHAAVMHAAVMVGARGLRGDHSCCPELRDHRGWILDLHDQLPIVLVVQLEHHRPRRVVHVVEHQAVVVRVEGAGDERAREGTFASVALAWR
jgi:hypothetical protein